MALVPQVVDAVGERVPVVAAGGLFDGRGLAASLALGADGVWIGTRFIATPEARAVPGYKETLLANRPRTARSSAKAYTGKTCRVVRNEWTQHFEEHPEELKPFPEQAFFSAQQGANHLGGDRSTPRSTCTASSARAARASGAINELVPAGRAGRSHRGRGRGTDRPALGHRGVVVSIDNAGVLKLVESTWQDDIVPALHDYIAIPALSPMFDASWREHGHIDDAVALVSELVPRPTRRGHDVRSGATPRPHADDRHRSRAVWRRRPRRHGRALRTPR